MKTTVTKALTKEYANLLYITLKDELKWEDGIFSRKYGGSTRKACMIGQDHPYFKQLLIPITKALNQMTTTEYVILGLYANYYEDGNMFTPSHSHKDTHQLVLSLGATRTLKVGSKEWLLETGDAVLFGSSPHSVPKEPHVKEGRISIATFMIDSSKLMIKEE